MILTPRHMGLNLAMMFGSGSGSIRVIRLLIRVIRVRCYGIQAVHRKVVHNRTSTPVYGSHEWARMTPRSLPATAFILNERKLRACPLSSRLVRVRAVSRLNNGQFHGREGPRTRGMPRNRFRKLVDVIAFQVRVIRLCDADLDATQPSGRRSLADCIRCRQQAGPLGRNGAAFIPE